MIMALVLLAEAPATPPCDNAMAQQDINRCLNDEFLRTDADMNAQWRLVSAAMKEADKGLDRSYDKQAGHFDTLLAGQRAWLRYRDEHCLLESFEMRGGSGQPMLDAGCKAELTQARTHQLRRLIAED